MPGLRRLAQVLHDRQSRIQHKTEEDEFKEKEIELEIPRDCDIYLDSEFYACPFTFSLSLSCSLPMYIWEFRDTYNDAD